MYMQAGQAAECRRGAEVLRLGLQERQSDGDGTRLRADAGTGDRSRRGRLARAGQGRRRANRSGTDPFGWSPGLPGELAAGFVHLRAIMGSDSAMTACPDPSSAAPSAHLRAIRIRLPQSGGCRRGGWLFRAPDDVLRGVRARSLLGILIALGTAAIPRSTGSGSISSSRQRAGTRSRASSARSRRSYGTLVTSVIALAIGVPVSFGIALFLTEMCPATLKRPLGNGGRVAGGDSVDHLRHVGLFVFASVVRDYIQPLAAKNVRRSVDPGSPVPGAPNGIGMLSAGIILSVMVIPFVVSVMRDVFEIVPPVLKESATGSAARPGRWCGTSCCLTRRSA